MLQNYGAKTALVLGSAQSIDIKKLGSAQSIDIQKLGSAQSIEIEKPSSSENLVNHLSIDDIIPYADVPGFPEVTISGHPGCLLLCRLEGVRLLILAGRAHPYESGNPAVMEPALRVLKEAGIERLVLTNAAGSLDEKLRPGQMALISDHINLAGCNPLVGMKGGAENFISMTDAYDPALRLRFKAAAQRKNIDLCEGIYAWFLGPSFETPAEIHMARMMGATLVGMSTAPEVILARRLGLRCAALSIITNMAAGIEGASPSHQEITDISKKAATSFADLLQEFIRDE